MTEVGKTIAIQFGIQYGGVSMDDFEELLDMIKEQKIAQISKIINKFKNEMLKLLKKYGYEVSEYLKE